MLTSHRAFTVLFSSMATMFNPNPLQQHLAFTEKAHPLLGGAAAVFDRLIGSWAMECEFIAPDGSRTSTAGEWHFGWVLGGQMLQDVLYFYPKGARPPMATDLKGGTTLRLFDAKSQQWQVTFFAPLRGDVMHLRGGVEGERIVLRGMDVDGAALRWSFNEISGTSFLWLGETSPDNGATWRIEQQMRLRRMPLESS